MFIIFIMLYKGDSGWLIYSWYFFVVNLSLDVEDKLKIYRENFEKVYLEVIEKFYKLKVFLYLEVNGV